MTKNLLEWKINAALQMAEMGNTDGDHHKMWVIDQMVRILTGCKTETRKAKDCRGTEYEYLAYGENEKYQAFKGRVGSWDAGIAP